MSPADPCPDVSGRQNGSRIDDPGDLAAEFVALNDYLYTTRERDAALQRLATLARRAVPDCDWAGVTAWPVNKEPFSLATSDDVARQVDQLQYELREGPCLTAAIESELVLIPDVGTEPRWPAFCERAASDTPVRGVSFHLVDVPQRCALNLYTANPGAFDDDDAVSVAAVFAAHARVLLIHAVSSEKAINLEHALATSRQIGTAIGILMNIHKITSDQAFDLLRMASQRLHRKLHDIAEDVTQTGTLPGPR